MKQFKEIVKMSQSELKKYLTIKLKEQYEPIVNDGFIYAQGKFPVLLVAHMDTVHKDKVRKIIYKDGKVSSPQGIGGDDRCGIYMILKIIEKYHCSVLFTEDEEVSGIGASKFTNSKLSDELVGQFNFIVELDRANSHDAVFYDCDNQEFEEFVTKEYFETAIGSFSDISYVAPKLKTAAVNLSCGYYKAHTTSEYIMWNEMIENINQVMKMFERMDEKKYEYVESVYSYNYYDRYYGYSSYDEYYDLESTYFDGKYIYLVEYDDYSFSHKYRFNTEEVYANSKFEAIGKFLMNHSYLTYDEIISVQAIDENIFEENDK